MNTRTRHGSGVRYLPLMGKSCVRMRLQRLIQGTMPLPLNKILRESPAPSQDTLPREPTHVGSLPSINKAHYLVTAVVEDQAQMAFHVISSHTCVVVKSHRIDGLTETNVMPKWWHTSSWRKQYPKEKTVRCTDIQTLKNTCAIGTRRNDLYALCPPYAAPKKSGRPKEATRIKGSIEMSLDNKKGKKGKKIPIEPEDDDIGKKKRGRSASPATQKKKKTKKKK